MRKLGFLILMIIVALPPLYAGDDDSAKKEKMFKEMREFKMKYLAKEIDLSDAQKQKFFELYDEMSNQRDACYREVRKMEKKLKKDGKDATEEDYQNVTAALNKANAAAAEIEKTYNDKFAEFLSPKQIYKLKEAEKTFREKLEEMRLNRKKEHKKK